MAKKRPPGSFRERKVASRNFHQPQGASPGWKVGSLVPAQAGASALRLIHRPHRRRETCELEEALAPGRSLDLARELRGVGWALDPGQRDNEKTTHSPRTILPSGDQLCR
jgi:hypothetical protein